MHRILLSLLFLALCGLSRGAAAATFVYVAAASDGDVWVYRLNPADGSLRAVGKAEAGKSVSSLALSPDRKTLYAATFAKPSAVVTFAIDPDSGLLTRQASAPMPDGTIFMSVDPGARYLFGASFTDDLISVHAIGSRGQVQDKPVQLIKTGRHAHAILPDANNRWVYATVLGSDQLLQFDLADRAEPLTPAAVATKEEPPGSGPRHLVFAPNGKFLYVIHEQTASVTSYAIDRSSGALTAVQTLDGIPKRMGLQPGVRDVYDKVPRIWASDIRVRPDGRFVYIAERTSSTVSVLACDPDTGTLQYVKTLGVEQQPRALQIDPSGQLLIVAGERSGQLGVYAIAPDQGTLQLVRRAPVGRGASAVEIVQFADTRGTR